MLKIRFLILIAILFAACDGKTEKNISTTDAFGKYGNQLKNKLFFVFPEVRENPLKWFDSIPESKLQKIVRPGYFTMKASPGEVFVWQIGVWALATVI